MKISITNLGVLHLMANEQAWILAKALRRTRICRRLNLVPRRHRKSWSPGQKMSDLRQGFERWTFI